MGHARAQILLLKTILANDEAKLCPNSSSCRPLKSTTRFKSRQ